MKHFVKLSDSGGLALAWPVEDVLEVAEMSPEHAKAKSRTGCVTVMIRTAGGPKKCDVIGTVDKVLAAIRDAQKETT